MSNTTKKWVVKVGSSILGGVGEINLSLITQLSRQIKIQRKKNQQIVLVTSGAISQGMKTLNIKERPTSVDKLQALASIGQIKIVSAFSKALEKQGLNAAQILLTAQDLSDRRRYLNAKNTIQSLLEQGVIPIVNENDTISTESIRFGDNDTLAALVANLLAANYLLLLTDQRGLYDKNPSQHKDARLIRECQSESGQLDEIKGLKQKSASGSGGMQTKINAVKTATKSGTHTIIASGFDAKVIEQIFEKPKSNGSFFKASISRQKARKLWLGYALKPSGEIIINFPAAKALVQSASLLAVGIEAVKGSFFKGDLVVIFSPIEALDQSKTSKKEKLVEVARGISNYSSAEVNQIKGLNTKKILKLFSFSQQEVVHRDNMLITKVRS